MVLMSPDSLQVPFALLDDCFASDAQPRSRLYTGWVRSLVCQHPDELPQILRTLQQLQRQQGLFALLLADYEWGAVLQGLPDADASAPQGACLRIELFTQLRRLSAAQTDDWLATQAQSLPPEAGALDWQAGLTQVQFHDALAQIHQAIAAGETYQVNFTFPFHARAYGHPLVWYRQLRQRQPAEFGALMRLPSSGAESGQWVLSFSPELFVRHRGHILTACPMKGTSPVGESEAQTQQRRAWLQQDAKNRAENVMIVDLLRNDLGRVAVPGSVQVRDLFDVQQHGQVLQMTSTVQAQLRSGVGLAEVLQAVFPCGSITGAPKHQTMRWIQRLESQPRGLYTGAIGWLDVPTGQAAADGVADDSSTAAPLWDFCLSVPIRTLLLHESADGMGAHRVSLPVGAGMVWDSRPDEEWQECALKSHFATASPVGFALFETMRVDVDGQIANLSGHLQRLRASAQTLGFRVDEAAITDALHHYLQAQLPRPDADTPAATYRLRLALHADGCCEISHGLLTALPAPQPVTLVCSDVVCDTPAWLRQHKTTLRRQYDAAMRQAEQQGAFDCLFFNEAGHLTEGARSNVLVQLDGEWLTPPLHDGVLPGTMRQQLLHDPAWRVREQSITRAQLHQATAVAVCNALRGVLMARVRWS